MRLALVVPYRDRQEHLNRFITHYRNILPNADIIVVEQADNMPFNRAKLFNVFYCERGKEYDYYAFHDVDMYLDTKRTSVAVYDYPDKPTHIATKCEQFNYKLPYPAYFGGVVLINRFDFEKSGGFSNNFWGWGGEDDEMRNNLNKKGIQITSREAYFRCAKHKRKIDRRQHMKNLQQLRYGRQTNDGFNHCNYMLLERGKMRDYYLIMAAL
jgi:predicted glycosyltransferase involved in capsule biosynthesis